ncbi:S8 family peptidase [Rubripirellula obstinata]|nr:S8 family serine peptidase [Rubripirellula obstinata]
MPRFTVFRLVLASSIVAFAILNGHFAQAQDINTVDWSSVVRYDSTDQTNPYYLAPDPTITWSGIATSQADTVMNVDSARANFGVTGSGLRIGVISDSFNVLNGAAAGISSGDLPGVGNPSGFRSPVNVVKDANFGTDEGRAMAELIHDLAPGAEILFHSAFNNPGSAGTAPSTTIANAIDSLRLAGADIIVDDVAILTAAKYQDGAAAQAVDRAFAAGIPYFSSAGNNGNNAYEGFQKSSAPAAGFNDLHDFNLNPENSFDQILNLGDVAPGGDLRATLKWEDPYASVGGTPSTDLSLSLLAFDSDGNFLDLVQADQNQLAGADPFEFISITNPITDPIQVGLVVDRVAGDAAKLISLEVFGSPIQDDSDTNSPTIHGHNAARGAVSVAAQFFGDAGLDEVEAFSAEGPTTILFDLAGNPLDVPEFRATPLITGIDGTDTSFFPAELATDVDGNGFPNFFGTSAAAPHVAAVAALVLEEAENEGISLSPEQLYELLYASTVDIESPGFDNRSGFGRLDAQLALSRVRLQVIPEPGTATLLLIAGVWTIGTRRRKR